ncbi:MetQ/NlpA family ABC transporter substrate-binding protein [Oscillospiraceae bacterium LCP25S3_E10]|nr:MetQ/NlpA family ABC transporter substrate-binding protein [Ruminococcus sp.]MDD6448002.1 MetQ/NlpA family ABC transporter substrate-binding protein [Ruminococcus sp.]MDY2856754.1 MetQ/NlpA family ABC transporter substrate-binding protein [Oscillospiraceae bacterium]
MKKLVSIILAAITVTTVAVAFAGCSSDNNSGSSASSNTSTNSITIAVPNDTTNEARSLLLLQQLGYIKLDENAGITATIKDIKENPKNIKFNEVEAAQVPNVLQDVDYAVINSNYALEANLNPVKDSLGIENSSSAYGNVIVVKEGNEKTDKIKALKAAVESKQVADFITKKYDGSVVSVVDNPTDGYDSSIDYNALKGEKITVAASPTPHAEILAEVKKILAKKDITLEVTEFTDYIQPNNVVESGEFDANYVEHKPYLDDFNQQNKTHLVVVTTVHVEPIGLYGGKQKTLDALK